MMKIEGHPEMEAIYYICVIPVVMNCIMFVMLSKISRLELWGVTKEERQDEETAFDLKEALHVGIVSGLCMNSII